MGIETKFATLDRGDWVRITDPDDDTNQYIEGQVVTPMRGIGHNSQMRIKVLGGKELEYNVNFYTVVRIRQNLIGYDHE